MSTIPRDGCLVTAAPFAELVQAHVERWNRDRPQLGGTWVPRDEVPPIHPLVWLSAEASQFADPTGEFLPDVLVPIGLLAKLRERSMIEFRVADAIATALGDPGLICDDRVEVIPNQRASATARAGCCAGSTYTFAA